MVKGQGSNLLPTCFGIETYRNIKTCIYKLHQYKAGHSKVLNPNDRIPNV